MRSYILSIFIMKYVKGHLLPVVYKYYITNLRVNNIDPCFSADNSDNNRLLQ